jgi:ACS family hexuronate transporter-like MFS transporter
MNAAEMKSIRPAPSVDPGKGVGRFRWVILGVLFCATTINYMDRFLLGVLKPTIVHDLHWTEMDYANVVFYFQLAYAIGLLTMSRIIDRLGVRAGMALVVGICALAAASHSIVSSAMGFCLARFALGFGESGAWPG